MALNWTVRDLEVIEAVIDGAARGFAFRAEEQGRPREALRSRIVPELERIQDYAETELGALVGCYGVCALCVQEGECAVGSKIELKSSLYRSVVAGHNQARENRRQSRYDRTRLRSFRRLMAHDLADRKDSKMYSRTRVAADNIIRYWSQWAKYHIKRF